MKKEDVFSLIELLRELAYEQATREFSGVHWFKDYVGRLDRLEKSLLNSEPNPDAVRRNEAAMKNRKPGQ